MPFIPHTQEEIQQMLSTIGVGSVEQLFDEIPDELKCKPLDTIPEGMNEMEITRLMQTRAMQDGMNICFAGAGAYDHHIPAAVLDTISRGEYMTAYTPYQAEASQGNLQLIYEYQTMMARLTGMDCSNASMYEGASALAEAVLMAVRANRDSKTRHILMPSTVHPLYRKTVHTIVRGQNIAITELPYHSEGGQTSLDGLKDFEHEDITALIIPQPNFFGVLEDVDGLTDWAHQRGAFAIGVVNPMSLSVLKPPGSWGLKGADIVCGEGQSLGVPLSGGGPYFGFLCTKKAYARQMPGRIVGRTVDQEGTVGYTLTLQAREQHIRRSKATSNICTNQGLMVTAATIYMSLLGDEGMRRVATHCNANTRALVEDLCTIPGVKRVFNRPIFHEAVLSLDKPAEYVLGKLAEKGFVGGYNLSEDYPELGEAILVCATEMRTEPEIIQYAKVLREILSEGPNNSGKLAAPIEIYSE